MFSRGLLILLFPLNIYKRRNPNWPSQGIKGTKEHHQNVKSVYLGKIDLRISIVTLAVCAGAPSC